MDDVSESEDEMSVLMDVIHGQQKKELASLEYDSDTQEDEKVKLSLDTMFKESKKELDTSEMPIQKFM
jgi:hypothetical protein